MRWLACILLSAACHHGNHEASAPLPTGQAWLTDEEVTRIGVHLRAAALEEVGGEVVTSGRVTFDDLRVSHVFSPVTGRVTKILANLGDHVKKGAPLLEIESPDVGQAFSDVAKAHADLIAAEHEYKRQKELYEAHATSRKDFETAEDNHKKAQAEYARARKKAQLFRAGADSVDQTFVLRALIDGEVIARNANPGVEVQGQYAGGTAVELFTIGELDPVWVLADVFETDLAQIKIGAHVSARVVAYPKLIFEGTVDWVSGSLDAQTRTARVRCRIRNPQRELKPEMYATVSVATASRPRQLAVPKSALIKIGDRRVVFVSLGKAPDGRTRYERRPVAVDEDEGGDYVPVTHGLTAGEEIVVAGADELAGML